MTVYAGGGLITSWFACKAEGANHLEAGQAITASTQFSMAGRDLRVGRIIHHSETTKVKL